MRTSIAPLLASLLLAGCAVTPPEPVRLSIQHGLELGREAVGPAMPTRPPRGMVRQVDISPDGVPDWLVDFEPLGFIDWCGTGGCRSQLFVSRPGGTYVVAFDDQSLGPPKIGRLGGETIVDLAVHGTHCDGAGADECLRRFAWNEAQGRLDERPNVKGDGRIQGPLMQIVPVEDAAIPAAVNDATLGALEACRAAGGSLGEGLPVLSAPDLNGDGRRDWIVDATYSGCTKDGQMIPPVLATRVFVTTPDGAAQAYAAEGLVYEIDVSTAPALLIRVLAADDCGRFVGRRCPEQALAWDAASGRFR